MYGTTAGTVEAVAQQHSCRLHPNNYHARAYAQIWDRCTLRIFCSARMFTVQVHEYPEVAQQALSDLAVYQPPPP